MSSVSGVGTISSAGVGSGLDVESIVTKLVAIEKQPITTLQKTETKLNSQLSSWGNVKSALASLRDAAQKLTLPSTWSATTASSSDTSAVNVSTNSSATAGSYSISVQSLATAQTLASASQTAATSTLGSGTLHIKSGASASATTVDVSISATDTLNDIRDKINAASTSVKASVVTDASGTRLVMRGTTGADNSFTVTTDDGDGDNTDASGLSALAYDPSSSIASMTQTQAAANSAATINGLTVTGASNTLTAIDGLTITLSKVTSAVDVTVKQDSAAISTSINSFATAYNSLYSLLADQTKYDASTKTAGTLQGDNTAVSIQTQMRSILGGVSGASSTYARMSDVGLEIQSDGSVKVNSTKLTTALGNLSELKKVFANAGSSTGASSNDGFAQRLRSYGDAVLGVDGALTTRTTGLQKTIDNNEKRQQQIQQQVDAYETRIRAQYTALDAAMASLTTQSSYITNMITAWNKA
jgi:flagellar hook-associated protein 2